MDSVKQFLGWFLFVQLLLFFILYAVIGMRFEWMQFGDYYKATQTQIVQRLGQVAADMEQVKPVVDRHEGAIQQLDVKVKQFECASRTGKPLGDFSGCPELKK